MLTSHFSQLLLSSVDANISSLCELFKRFLARLSTIPHPPSSLPFFQSYLKSAVGGTVVDSWIFSETPVFAVVGGDGGVDGVGAKYKQNLTWKLILFKVHIRHFYIRNFLQNKSINIKIGCKRESREKG